MAEKVQLAAKTSKVKENSASTTRKIESPQSMSSPADQVLYLQRTIGNQAVQRLIKSGALQAKLKIGQPGDMYEQEADRVADAVMRMPEPQVQRQLEPEDEEEELVQGKTLETVQLQPEEEKELRRQPIEEEEEEELQRQPVEEEEEELQTKATSGHILDVEKITIKQQHPNKIASLLKRRVQIQKLPEGLEEDGRVLLKKLSTNTNQISNNIEKNLSFTKGGGSPLQKNVRSFMESRFGTDFKDVRVHTDDKAIQMAQDLNAVAFTNVSDIYFNSGQYNPSSNSGKRILAHELTHVIHQSPNLHRISLKGTNLRISHSTMRRLQRQVEVHVNLRRQQKVKLFRQRGNDTVFSPVSAGPATESLIRIGPYSITKRPNPTAQIGRWGLQYFAIFHLGRQIGFHSNIAYPKRRTLCEEGFRSYCTPRSSLNNRIRRELIVNGIPMSHGCVRMIHPNAQTLFNAVSNGTHVRVYKRRRWRTPSWRP